MRTWAPMLVLLASCQLMTLDYVRVVALTPAPGTAPSSFTQVSVRFDREVRHDRAEAAITLTENGKTLEGVFHWSGTTVTFTPSLALHDEAKYVFTVEKSVEDEQGYGMADAVRAVYGQATPPPRPRLLSVSPIDESEVAGARPDLVWTFDRAMDVASVQDQISIAPSLEGYFGWTSDQTEFTFHPTADLPPQTQFVLTVPASTRAANGASFSDDQVTRFFHGSRSATPPVITLSSGSVLTAGGGSVNAPGLEKDAAFVLSSDQDLETSLVASQITVSPAVSFNLEWDAAQPKKVVTLRPTAPLIYGQTYQLVVRRTLKTTMGTTLGTDQTYWFAITGDGSRPLEVTRLGVVAYPDAGVPTYTLLSETAGDLHRYDTLALGGFPASSTSVNTVVDVYFRKPSPTVTLNYFTLTQGLVLSNPGSDSMVVYAVVQDPGADAYPSPTPASDETVVRYYIAYGQNDLTSGFLTYRVETSILDARGNALPSEYQFPVLKVK